jgi:hypothetical protein
MKYFPISTEPNMEADGSDLFHLTYHRGALAADFLVPDDENQLLRVSFDRAQIFRVLDEMPLSTEENWQGSEGWKKNHFAYRVEGSKFVASQSELFLAATQIKHYRFITGNGCLDVLSERAPTFSVVPFEYPSE